MNYPSPSELWEMSTLDFNKWRRENDLKELFTCFEQTLPHFCEWLISNNLTIEFILETDNPGHFFYWKSETYCIKTIKESFSTYLFVPVYDKNHEKQIEKTKNINTETEEYLYFKYKPYFLWVKDKYKIDKPIKTKFSGNLETFRYVTGSAPDVPDLCNWSISPGIQVLKLGGLKIDGWINFNNRNLDFTNLDFLEIEGKDSWNTEIQIFYSHCANISTHNVVANFTKFYGCYFQNFNVTNSRLYWVEFYNCDIFKSYYENSSISNLIIDNCCSNNFSFNRVEVENIDYLPPKKEYHCSETLTNKTVSENYKKFRILYQSNGLRQESSESYYNERLYELKYNWGSLELGKSFKYLLSRNLEYGFSAIKHNFKSLFKCISDYVSYKIWGFGEKPLRIISTTLFCLLIYSILFYFSGICKLDHNAINSLYLSIVTFTTLGYGDITPIDNSYYKIIVGSEALIGAFCMGLLVAGFANKSKY